MPGNADRNAPLHDLLDEIGRCLPECRSVDSYRLGRELAQLKKLVESRRGRDSRLDALLKKVAASVEVVEWRRRTIPSIRFPDNLPVAERREDIARAITGHQVVVIAGETGSGKTTQLPKICLESGCGARGMIGHTQPRRLAARTVASRIAEELAVPLGREVGFQVRFADQSSAETRVKLMTDGILLMEIQRDRYLSRYDTLIIDEAHERSLNIDFLLGYLKQILPKRPDLKLIITSATIDVARFAEHFGGAPVIEVSGRTYPVTTLYRPLTGDDGSGEADIFAGIVDALAEIQSFKQRGDTLVFLSGEREIREAALAIRKAQFRDLDVLPLYARLSITEQNRIFQPHKGHRVVLATNVAETSITVPGILYVIDTGLARISRYSYRTKVQRLPIEPVSQASANQRAGRCGRVAAGTCIRLYSEEDFLARREFTEPEIVRTNLAAVILQMLQLRIGDIHSFPFVEAPDQRLINDGFRLLEELQAVDEKGGLTAIGRQLCRLPVDPRLARMLIEAGATGCLDELLVVTSFLSLADPRQRPADKQQAADEKHRAWRDSESDFSGMLKMWCQFEEQRQELSRNDFNRYCADQFVSVMRMKEWRDLEHQIRLACRELGLRTRSVKKEQTADYGTIHRAILSGLLTQIGFRHDEREYMSPRSRKFHVFPGSALFPKPPKWLMAAELLETSRVYAHNVAGIDPEWLQALAGHLINKSYSEPHYDSRRGLVMAYEKQTLQGLVIQERHCLPYGAIDPLVSRQVFIQSALVEERYRGKGAFFRHNRALLRELEDLEARVRRRDILVDPKYLYEFYDARLPEEIHDLAGFEHWRKQAERQQPKLLFFERKYLLQRSPDGDAEAQYPDGIDWRGIHYALKYRFEPGRVDDGLTVVLPLAQLHQAPRFRFEWLVPGMLRDKCVAMVKSLPKPLRRHFVPVPDYVDRCLADLKAVDQPLGPTLGRALQRLTAVKVDDDNWREAELDNFYRANFSLVDEAGREIVAGRDLAGLQLKYRDQVQETIRSLSADSLERSRITQWDFGDLPEECELQHDKLKLKAYPALVDERQSVALHVLDNRQQALWQTRRGLVRLAILMHPQPASYLRKKLFTGADLRLKAAGLSGRIELAERVSWSAYRLALLADRPLPRTEQQFGAAIEQYAADVVPLAVRMEKLIAGCLDNLAELHRQLHKSDPSAMHAVTDIKQQLGALFGEEFPMDVPPNWLRQYPRYISGILQRLDRLAGNQARDRQHSDELAGLLKKLKALEDESRVNLPDELEALLTDYRFMLQEYRISLFAQQLKTVAPVSAKRLDQLWRKIVALQRSL